MRLYGSKKVKNWGEWESQYSKKEKKGYNWGKKVIEGK